MAKENSEAARCDFISRCKVDPKSELYSIGLAVNGITLYKQQVRSLNLVYALSVTDQLKGSLAVIGGGAAGATAALAAASLGCEVTIFEQRPTLFHLQQGCDIRWLHPHIYEWPAPGTDSPYAGLPLLDWEFATAAEVAARLQVGWDLERTKNPAMKLIDHLGASAHVAGGSNKGLKVRWDNSLRMGGRSGEQLFDTVIVAVGFGVERGVLGNKTQSYWRNDSVNQLLPGIPSQRAATYFVSGTGDGGLIDLLRVCINDFNQGRILEDLFTPDDAIIEKLRDIIKEWNGFSGEDRKKPDKQDWLYRKYEALTKDGTLNKLNESLDGPRRRCDTVVNLNGREPTFSQSLSLASASLFNTLLAYVLYGKGAFSYVPGECVRMGESTAQVTYKKFQYDYPVDRLIMRHGPLRWETLEAVGLTTEQIDMFKSQQDDVRYYAPDRLWPAGWWKENRKPPVEKSESQTEFVSPVTQAIATTFVKTLGQILMQEVAKKSKKSQFRLTLHRIVRFQDEVMFQQVSRYAGTQTEGAVGRAISIKAGLVGMVCQHGAPLIVTREKDFDQLWKDVGLEEAGARGVRAPVMSMLACPFFSFKVNGADPHSVLAVLFMDSEEKDFFADENVLKLIYSACKGFVLDLDEKKSKREIGFVTTDWRGYEVVAKPEELAKLEAKYESIADDMGVFEEFEFDLTFKVVSSLEMHSRGIRP